MLLIRGAIPDLAEVTSYYRVHRLHFLTDVQRNSKIYLAAKVSD